MVERTNPQFNDHSVPVKELEFSQPVINIGSHPENDITISGDGILPFHAMLVVQDNEYRIASLSPEARLSLDGKPVNESSFKLTVNQKLDLGDFSLSIRGGNVSSGIRIALFEITTSQTPRVYIMENGEKAILMNLASQLQEVDVEQAATYEIEVVNAGPIVASFQVQVEGVPPEWVEVTPKEINLNEGRRSNIKIAITPPRASTSIAGKHPISFIASSPNYPGHTGELQTELIIRPYYEFSLGALTPKNQNIFWKARSGQVKLPIQNNGNSEANFDVLTIDDENGCSFEYKIKEGVELSRQATVNVPAGSSYTLPMEISPVKRPMVAFRSKRYQYNTTVQVSGQGGALQMVSGSATSIPLFGWWSIVAAVLVVAIGLFILLQPRIYNFQVSAGKDIIELGDTTNLDWSVSPFATRLNISGQDKPIDAGMTHLTVNPVQSTIYELVAGNWLSGLTGLDQKWLRTVLVIPPAPSIAAFDVDHPSINKGLPVIIRWSVIKADKVLLTIGEVVTELPKEQFSGEKSIVLDQDTVVTLEAQNLSGSQLRSAFVKVVPPHINVNKFTVWVRPASTAIPGTATSALDFVPHLASLLPLITPTTSPTPIATPSLGSTPTAAAPDTNNADFPQKFVELVVDKSSDIGYRVNFLQPKRQLSKGEQVMVEWDVDGTDTISITPFTDILPAKGKQPFFPQQSLNFVMTAKNGELQKLFMLPVTVFDGTPPVAPTIQFFKGAPTTSVGAADVQFSWSVSGAWTHIKLTTGDTVVADWVNAQGFKTVTVSTSATYVLTAWNGQLSTAVPLDITINPTLKASTLTVTDVYPHAGYFKVGDSVNVYVSLTNLPAGIASPTGTVIVTDDYATCTISLPVKFCTLKFTTPGTKQIKASYSGDAVYLPEDSAVYTDQSIVVEANKVSLSPTYHFLYNGTKGILINDLSTAKVLVGQGLDIVVAVTPVNSTMPNDTFGSVTVRQCPINTTTNLPDTSSCLSYGPATVKVTTDATGTNVGTGEVYLPYTQKTGKFGLLISYSHSQGAFDPTLVGSTADDKIPFTVDYGDLILIPQGVNPADCTYNGGPKCIVHQGKSIDIAFTTKLMLKEKDSSATSDIAIDLFSTFPKPNNLVVQAAYKDALGAAKVADWSNNCAWQVISAKRQLLCTGVDMTYPVVITYSFLGGSDANYAIKNRSIPVAVAVRKATAINFDQSAINGKYVGQKVQLQGGASDGMHIYTYLSNETGSPPITGAVTYMQMTDKSDISTILSVVTETSTCKMEIDPTNNINSVKLVQSATPASGTCFIYFKKAGAYSFTLFYEGDVDNDKSTAAVSGVTINKQTGLSLGWNPTIISSYALYDNIPNDTGDTISFVCDSTSNPNCANFVPDVLKGATIVLDTNTSAASGCTVYQNTTVMPGGAHTLPLTLSSSGVMELTNIKFRCTAQGPKTIALNFTGDSSSAFDFATSGTHTLTFSINPLTRAISPSIYKYTDTSLTTNTLVAGDSFNPINVGEVYFVAITMDNMPSDMTPDHSIDKVHMTWPLAMTNALDAAKSTCSTYKVSQTSTTATYDIPFDLVQGTAQWLANCQFSFSSIADLGTNKTIDFATNDSRVTGSNTPSIDLANSIVKKSLTITPEIRIDNGTALATYPNKINTTSPYSTTESLWIGENYYIVATLKNVGTDAAPGSSTIGMTWPTAFDGLLDQTTCSGSNGSYTFNLTKVTNADSTIDWQGSCMFRFKTLPSSFTFPGTMSLSLTSNRFSANSTPISITNIQKRTPSAVVALSNGVEASGSANQAWIVYAKSTPKISITFSDSHYRVDIKDEINSTNFSASLGSTALTCTPDSSNKNIFSCLIPDTTSIAKSPINIQFSGSTDFAAVTDSSNNKMTVSAIPVQIDTSNLVWTDTDSTTHPFPEVMHCVHCKSGAFPDKYFIFYGTTTVAQVYHITVPVKLNLPGTTTIPGTTQVDGGQVTMTLKSTTQGQSVQVNSTAVSGGLATFTYTATANSSLFVFSSVDLAYSYLGGAFDFDSQSLVKSYTFVPRVSFSLKDYNNSGFEIVGLPDNICFRIYFEKESSSSTCEDQDCWQTEWPNDGSGNYVNNRIMANCSGHLISDAAGDGKIDAAGTDAWHPTDPSKAYQIYLQAWAVGSDKAVPEYGSPFPPLLISLATSNRTGRRPKP